MSLSTADSPPPITAPANADPRFRYWQTRTLIGAVFGYAAFYFVRKNLSFAMPAMQDDLGISKVQLGGFLTAHGLLYGASRFVNGIWADRTSARYFMVAGLLLSVCANVFFGFSSAVLLLGVAWLVNGWTQGMGFPPSCRLMTHWYAPRELATKMSVWNTSHSIGTVAASVFCGYMAKDYGWRWCFFGPAILCTIAGFILFVVLRDTPSSVGLPEIGVTDGNRAAAEDRRSASYKAFVKRQVFQNPFIWWISFANFFLYVLRFAIIDWGPTLIKEMKHFPVLQSGWMVGAFEAAGAVGMLLAGWITDRVFAGRGSRTCVFCMVGATAAMLGFWKLGVTPVAATAFLIVAGFFLYGPQALIGIIAANLSTRRASATGAGFTGIFGYASTPLSGWGLGWLAQHFGWDAAMGTLLVAGGLSALMFVLAWLAPAHGYEEEPAA